LNWKKKTWVLLFLSLANKLTWNLDLLENLNFLKMIPVNDKKLINVAEPVSYMEGPQR
jgi:hypothetical protein